MKKNLHAYIYFLRYILNVLGVMLLLLEQNREFKTFPLFYVIGFVRDANFCWKSGENVIKVAYHVCTRLNVTKLVHKYRCLVKVCVQGWMN